VDVGSCNDGNVELAALWNPQHDAERFGLKLVVSPHHADVLLVVGPLVRSMEQALLATLRAMPEPRRVVTLGDDFDDPAAIFRNSYAIISLPQELLQARGDNHIPGNPPAPQTILEHFLALPTS
jgi:Ni,Fe-hydrogenase III small subunit